MARIVYEYVSSIIPDHVSRRGGSYIFTDVILHAKPSTMSPTITDRQYIHLRLCFFAKTT